MGCTYLMNRSEFELVFLLVVKDNTVFVEERHHGRLPPRRSQESNNHIEEPILHKSSKVNLSSYRLLILPILRVIAPQLQLRLR